MKNKRLLLTITLLFILIGACIFNAFAHSGRTDGSGGHRDNSNQSGLGSYHYHCGGYPPHLHTGGVCPYKTKTTTKTYTSTSNSKYDEGYDDGYEDGYDRGYDRGYDVGNSNGHHKGYIEGYDKGFDDAEIEYMQIIKIMVCIALGIILILLLVKFIKKQRKG